MRQIIIVVALIVACLAICVRAGNNESIQKGKTMTARGTFDVKVTPQPPDDSAGGPFGRLFLDKQFHGELNATSKGQMMAAETAVKGSGAYVAFELVSGVLNGKRGTFILQHRGTMRKGAYVMDVTVVPDSGTGELSGLAGAMKIIIEAGKHSYEFEYTLDEK
ncbi:MAG TPA: DUF3224 domain-containing protein [Pyrinomonadaceae bacterium]|nr:DUF3224 domain-containing protein [Pyrinomonadaceae bacterium]